MKELLVEIDVEKKVSQKGNDFYMLVLKLDEDYTLRTTITSEQYFCIKTLLK